MEESPGPLVSSVPMLIFIFYQMGLNVYIIWKLYLKTTEPVHIFKLNWFASLFFCLIFALVEVIIEIFCDNLEICWHNWVGFFIMIREKYSDESQNILDH